MAEHKSLYEDAIVSALHKYIDEEEIERGIMCWYGEENSVDDKVQSVFFTAEEREGKLWDVAVCRVVGQLTPEELGELKDYITGQASDGWGESFEQHEINTSDGDIYAIWSVDRLLVPLLCAEQCERNDPAKVQHKILDFFILDQKP